ncbi:MAG: hypothetical protein WAQ24_00455 [Candidatus Saccharimonadales bacterium]
MERSHPEQQKEIVDDNARKFVIAPLSAEFLKKHEAVGYLLVTDWLETESDKEKKVVLKEYDDGSVERLLITKVTKNGTRASEKQKITEEEYHKLVSQSVERIEKRRFEFNYLQSGVTFVVKYDEFLSSGLCMLEVDAQNDKLRDSFEPFVDTCEEVTGDLRYYGYRIAHQI